MTCAGATFVSSALVLTTFVAALPVRAADCGIEHGAYAEFETGVELRFQPTSGENTPLSHGLEVVVGDLTLDGHVLYDEMAGRPEAMVMFNCPEGDVTGADIAACTIWRGYVYGSDDMGNIDLLPPEGADAPLKLLLPGFGPALKASSIGDAISATPWDVFEFKHCIS